MTMDDVREPVAPAKTVAPVMPGERLETLDTLRGIAVLGILAMNIYTFALPFNFYLNPGALDPIGIGLSDSTDRFAYMLTHVLAEYKFITLFSLMFGAGIAMQFSKAASGEDGRKQAMNLHLRRMTGLLLIGAVHAYFLWFGDILFIYAVIGFLVGVFIPMKNRTLMISAVVLILFGALVAWGPIALLGLAPPEVIDEVGAGFYTPPEEEMRRVVEIYQSGGYLAELSNRVVMAAQQHVGVFFSEYAYRTLGIMLIGIVAFRSGFLSGRWPIFAYAMFAVVGIGIGLPLTYFGFIAREAVDFEFIYSFSTGKLYNYFGSLFAAAGYAGLIILLVKIGVRPLVWLLQPVGRLALTNYLLHTIICTVIFYGSYGFGLYGTMGPAELVRIVLMIFAGQIVFSLIYVQIFRMGPFEWLWRAFSYKERPPLLR